MRSYSSVKSIDRTSRCAVLMAVTVCGIVLFAVARTLALSNPFPTVKQHEWILDDSSIDVAAEEPRAMPLVATMLAMASPELPASEAEAEPEPEPATPAKQPRMVAAAAVDPPHAAAMLFKARWSSDVPYWKEPSPIVVTPQVTRLAPPARVAAAPPPKREGIMEAVDRYLWEVYQRAPVKSDSSGDFTWKDPAAANRLGMSIQEYVIGGMDPDFREQLYHAGRAMDAAGIRWSMLSAFRDDYRQGLASGLKAHGGNSLHGGSTATGGYGHGRAVDVTNTEGDVSVVWHWVDTHGTTYGLSRPMPGYDPSHIQSHNGWHDLAQHLREARTKLANDMSGNAAEPPTGSTRVSARTSRSN
jgi:hypothetical protein